MELTRRQVRQLVSAGKLNKNDFPEAFERELVYPEFFFYRAHNEADSPFRIRLGLVDRARNIVIGEINGLGTISLEDPLDYIIEDLTPLRVYRYKEDPPKTTYPPERKKS